MLIDRPQVLEGSSVINLTVPTGTSDPTNPSMGELFFRTDLNALRTFSGTAWAEAGSINLGSHTTDLSVHLSPQQNVLLDSLTATAAELNYSVGVTSSIQTQLNSGVSSLNTHVSDTSVHLTAAQNSLLDGLASTLTAVELNYVDGVTGSIQTQLNNIYSTDSNQDSRLSTIENIQVPTVQTNLTNHIADLSAHLTSAQNILLDTTISNGITAADIAKLSSASTLTSSIKVLLDGLESSKLSLNGSLAMSGNLQLGGFRITGLGTPTAPSDAVTKDYVDSFVQGLHWVGSTRVGTIGNIVLSGLQTIDGVSLSISDRVLVKNQSNQAENGIYLAASGAWSRANDYNVVLEVNNSAVFVLEGTTQGKSTWVQTSAVSVLGTSPITFSAFSGPVVNSAGAGILLGPNGSVSVIEGAGIALDGNNALVVDVHSAGGLMLTTNNTTGTTLTTVSAQLALTNTGVTAGTYQSGTQITPFTVDSKGRLTSVGTTTTITPAFSSITGKPTTLSGFGITDAVPIAGGVTMTGSLSWSSGTSISGGTPSASSSYFSTAAYGVSQGDNRTHFGYNTGTGYVNYLRGATTFVDGNQINSGYLSVTGNLSAGNASSTVLANNFVLRDSNGYLNASFIQSSDNAVSTGVTGVMVKTGDNYLRTGSAASIASFISGQNFNTTGNADTATVASSANSVLWTNVSGRPTNVSAFTNDAGYVTSGTIGAGYVAKTGDTMTGVLALSYANPALHLNTTGGGQSANVYFSTAGSNRWRLGKDSSAEVGGNAGSNFFLNALANDGTTVVGTALSISRSTLAASFSGNLNTQGVFSVGANFAISASGIVQTIQGYSPPNNAIRLTPNFHLNPGPGSAVICSWDNGNGGSSSNQAFRVGNGSGGDVFSVTYAGNTTIVGNVSAANITPSSGTPSRIVQADSNGYIFNNYFNSTDNTQASGVSAVMVKAGDNYYRSGTAAAIASFISGQNFNTTGNAATATSATSATTATNSTQLGGVPASGYALLSGATFTGDITTYRSGAPTTGVVYLGNSGSKYLYFDGSSYYMPGANLQVNGSNVVLSSQTTFNRVRTDAINQGSYGSISISGNTNGYAGINFSDYSATLMIHGSISGVYRNNSTWDWYWENGVLTAGTVPGARVSGAVSNTTSISSAVGTSYNWTAVQDFISSGAVGTAGRAGTLEAMGLSGNPATMSFHRSGAYAINVGLDTDNVFRIGGWSDGTNVYRIQIDASGNLTARGDVVAYSDRRLKTDVQAIQEPLRKIEELNGVTFKRIDSSEQGTGLIAQDVQAVLPEAVHEMSDGTLTVAYGNLAGLFVEAIKALNREVADLRAEIKALKDTQ